MIPRLPLAQLDESLLKWDCGVNPVTIKAGRGLCSYCGSATNSRGLSAQRAFSFSCVLLKNGKCQVSRKLVTGALAATLTRLFFRLQAGTLHVHRCL